ncbi:hypothetical protein HY988_03080 [Candidatus Micrarchaeota archaeon]|nr:hypothetical protein [Candidatus Micrarchaeota archaeon]
MQQLHGSVSAGSAGRQLLLPGEVPASRRSRWANLFAEMRIDRPFRVQSLLSDSMKEKGNEGQNKLDRSIELFGTLTTSQQAKVLSAIRLELVIKSDSPFVDDESAGCVRRLADFFVGTLTVLHPHKRGYPVADYYETFIELFRKIIEVSSINGAKYGHTPAVLACTKALWEVGYFDEEFWSRRLNDSVTRPFTIAALLEMPMVNTTLIDREKLLAEAGEHSVGQSSSSWKYEFLQGKDTGLGFDLDEELSQLAKAIEGEGLSLDSHDTNRIRLRLLFDSQPEQVIYLSPWGNAGLSEMRWREISDILGKIVSACSFYAAADLLDKLASEYRPGAVDALEDANEEAELRYQRSPYKVEFNEPRYDYFHRKEI